MAASPATAATTLDFLTFLPFASHADDAHRATGVAMTERGRRYVRAARRWVTAW
jgi:hypothetical protein